MIALPQRTKRPRSPSPAFEPDIASPLDVLLKRRRKGLHQQQPFGFPETPNSAQSPIHGYEPDYFQQGGNGVPHTPVGEESLYDAYGQPRASNNAESSSAAQLRAAGLNQAGVGIGVERRRTKHWNRINAPIPGQFHQTTQQHPNALATPVTHNDVYRTHPNSTSSAFPFPTPPPPPRAVSTRAAAIMSSSPIRNQPPSSSPFKDTKPNNDDLVGADEIGEPMDEEEMVRNWGEAYAEQNSILHSLHMTRMRFTQHASPPSHPSTSTHSSSNPWRTPMASSSTLYSPGPSRFAQEAGQISPHPYRTPYQSSPFTPARPSGNDIAHMYPASSNRDPYDIPSSSERHQYQEGDDEMGDMEAEAEIMVESHAEREVANRYEETNRLLGELAMVRRQRWGQEES
ncbi:hypothetical protein IAR50_006044 [Cryptococcus sp. DSM 104548]